MIAASRGVMNIEITNAPGLLVGGPPLAPSWISVLLVEEAKAGGTPCLGCPREDQDIRLLAGVAMPASMTICDDSFGSPCVWGTLFSSDIAGTPLPVVPDGISFPIGAVNPAGSDGLCVAGGPVGPYGTLSPSDSDPAGSDGPYVAGGPVGPDGTLSPFISDPAGPFGTLFSSDSDPADSDGPYVAGGPVGPFGMLCPFISDPAYPDGPDGPYGPYVPRLGHCLRLTLRYWWTLMGCSLLLTLHQGICSFRVKEDQNRVQEFCLMIWCWGRQFHFQP